MDPRPETRPCPVYEGIAWGKWSEWGAGELVPESQQLSWERNSFISMNWDVYWGTWKFLPQSSWLLCKSPSLQTWTPGNFPTVLCFSVAALTAVFFCLFCLLISPPPPCVEISDLTRPTSPFGRLGLRLSISTY